MYETLRISANLDSFLSSCSHSKREISYPEMIPLFVKKRLMIFQKLFFVMILLDLILVI